MARLLRTATHMAVASSVHGRVQRRQAAKWAAPAAPAAAAPAAAAPVAAASMDDKLAQLKQLGELKDAGILTQAEFDAKKALILA
jgi:hypothetical protein